MLAEYLFDRNAHFGLDVFADGPVDAGVALDGFYQLAGDVAQDVVADHRARRLSADVTLAPGPRVRFGAVAVQGNNRTRENRVRKIAGIPQGETFDPAEIDRILGKGADRADAIARPIVDQVYDIVGMIRSRG